MFYILTYCCCYFSLLLTTQCDICHIMMTSCSLISVTERLPGPALELGALTPVSAVTAGVEFSAPGLELTMVVTMGELAVMVTRELVTRLVRAQLLGAALLAHCARAPR